MKYREEIVTSAKRRQCWSVLSTVVTWPQWTASIRAVRPLGSADLLVGARFRIDQPGFPPAVWRVSEVRKGESFTWVNRSPGLTTIAVHQLSDDPDGGTRITLTLEQTGLLAGLMSALTSGRTRRYLRMEAAGLKAASESIDTGA